MRRERRGLPTYQPPTGDERRRGLEAHSRGREPDSGDVVSTNRGLLRFQGSPSESTGRKTSCQFDKSRSGNIACPVPNVTMPPTLTAGQWELERASWLETQDGRRSAVRSDRRAADAGVGHHRRGGEKVQCSAREAISPRQPANPAAGSAKGSGQVQREFFKKCVDNGGNVDTTTEKTDK